MPLALAGAFFAVVLAVPIAVLLARYRGRIDFPIESVGYPDHTLPGIMVGHAHVFLSLPVVPYRHQTVTLLIFAYAVLFMSKAIGSTRSGLAAGPPSLVDVSPTQSLSLRVVRRRVTFRLAASAIDVGALFVGIAVLKGLSATLFHRSTRVSALAFELWKRTSVLK